MQSRLLERVLEPMMRVMQKIEKLTPKEERVGQALLVSLKVPARSTKNPLVVGIVGLTGSGKTTVARELAQLVGAVVVEGDEIRNYLRKEGERYEGTRKIAENLALEVTKRGGNVVVDSDHIDPKKRASLRAKFANSNVKVVFLRVYCGGGDKHIPGSNFDIMIARIVQGEYEEFFGEAKSPVKNGKIRTAVVKLREMWRRTPHHYHWSHEGGGKWRLKKLPFKLIGEIDTADEASWKHELKRIAEKLKHL